jgi:hypothetical protein
MEYLSMWYWAKICSSNLRSHLPKIILCSLLKIFTLSNPYQRCWPKISWRKDFSCLSKVKISFLRKVSSFVGYTINWIIIPSLLVFKPSKLLNLIEKGLSYLRVFLSVQAKSDCPVSEIELSGCRVFNSPPEQNLPLHFFSLSTSQEPPWGHPKYPHWQFLDSSMESLDSWVDLTPQGSETLISPSGFEVFILLKVFLTSSSISLLHG